MASAAVACFGTAGSAAERPAAFVDFVLGSADTAFSVHAEEAAVDLAAEVTAADWVGAAASVVQIAEVLAALVAA